MTKEDFGRLFSTTIEKAVEMAEARLGRELPKQYKIQLHGAGHGGDFMDVTEALDTIYIGDGTFYAIIDVAVLAVSRSETTLFVRVSAHQPVPFDKTWNTPPGNGPFKVLIVPDVKVTS